MKPVFESSFAKAKDSFESAEVLFAHHHYAGAVNRCYYAMFYVVSALVHEKLNKHIKTHSGLLKSFNDEFVNKGKIPKALFISFKKGYEKRQVADYDIDSAIDEVTAKPILEETRLFLDSMREIINTI